MGEPVDDFKFKDRTSRLSDTSMCLCFPRKSCINSKARRLPYPTCMLALPTDCAICCTFHSIFAWLPICYKVACGGEEFAPIQTQIDLLNRYWERRVTDSSGGDDRESVLRKVLAEMVSKRRLQVDRQVADDSGARCRVGSALESARAH